MNMGQNNIVGGFLANQPKFSAAKPQMKFQNLKTFGVKIQKIGIFLSQMWLNVSNHVSKTKKHLCRLCSPYKAAI